MCWLRIEIRQAVEALRPWALQVVTQPQIPCEPARGAPGVVKIQSAINLLAGSERWNDGLGKKMIFKIVEIVRVPQQEIGKRKSCPGDTGKGSEARLSGNTEIECSAGNVGLRVVIPPDLELEAKMTLMMASQRRDAWRHVILGIAVLNEALALGAHDVVGKVRHARRRRRAHFGGHPPGIASRPTDRCPVETRGLRAPVVR